MTIWDNIYKDFNSTGKKWATLDLEGLDPYFLSFFEKNKFENKKAFDLGVGDGRYLNFLEKAGFSVNGLDSSETAVEMTKKQLENSVNIFCADMFEFVFPENAYDLFFSIATIHHGHKKEVAELIARIYKSLIVGAKVFITLPDFASAEKWETFKNNTKIAEGTYAPNDGPEKGLAHSFFREAEVKELFAAYNKLEINLDERGRWIITAEK